MVVHGAMDGYSRMLMFLQCSNNNQPETVKQLFSTAVTQFGRIHPLRMELTADVSKGMPLMQVWVNIQIFSGFVVD